MPEPSQDPDVRVAVSRRGALTSAAGGVLGGATAFLLRGALGADPARAQVPVPGADRTFYMFVQNARSGRFERNGAAQGLYRLTLDGVQPHTIYFSDRPARDAGLSPMKRFLPGLGFSPQNPPNAALVVAGRNGDADTLVIEIFSPRYDAKAERLTYDARILDRNGSERLAAFARRQRDKTLPRRFGEASLFIDDCPDGGVQCTGPGLPPSGITVANRLPCCWHWLGGCRPCNDTEYTDVCTQNVAGCGDGECQGVGVCIGGV